MRSFGALLLLLLCAQAGHARRAVMEGLAASANTVLISTVNTRVSIATTSYNGTVATVGLYVTSNVVISSDETDNIVFYATGSLVLNGTNIGSQITNAAILTATQTFSGQNTFGAASTFSGGVTLNGGATVSSTATFRSSTTFLGSMVGDQIISSYVVWVGTNTPGETILFQVGVTSVTDNGAGDYTVTLSTPFTTPFFSVQCTCAFASSGGRFCQRDTAMSSTGHIRISAFSDAGVLSDCNQLNVWSAGRQ
ncbi:MAG: hypothetical protein QME66_05810 [Candidatus Eisenbacteria bacterium]|nr:hypothetical protein [Candidatus Eisenbacteria bacterium]